MISAFLTRAQCLTWARICRKGNSQRTIFRTSLLVLAAGATLFATGANASSVTFAPGAYAYTVPAGVTHVSVVVLAGGGGGGGSDFGNGSDLPGNGGNGGRSSSITAVINVTPGQVISGTVGAGGALNANSGSTVGSSLGGSGGTGTSSGSGGGGGGGSSLKLGSATILVAGGGGGGDGASRFTPGTVGAASLTTNTLASCTPISNGGAGASWPGDGSGGGGGGYSGGNGGGAGPDHTSSTAGNAGATAGTSCTATTAGLYFTAPVSAPGPISSRGFGVSQSFGGSAGGAGSVTLSYPDVKKVFSPTTITSGANTTLTFTLSNPIASAQSVSFTDTLPSGLKLPASVTVGGTCASAASATAAPANGTASR